MLTKDDLEYHFIYCGNTIGHYKRLYFPDLVHEFKLGSAVVTSLKMMEIQLVTKETMKKFYKEKFKLITESFKSVQTIHNPLFDTEDTHFKGSVGDDLESFFMNLRNGILKSNARTFFLPKTSSCERKLIEERSEVERNILNKSYIYGLKYQENRNYYGNQSVM